MSIEASSDLEELFRLNITFDASKELTIETRNISDRARRVRQATTVTKWRNTTCLGQGASGVVWLQQEDGAPESCRAVKEIPRGTRSAPLPVDYRRELLALGRLSKREDLFVRFLGWYEDNRSIYLAMEYFEQGDLGRHLSARLPEDEVRVISKQLLEGLAVLHSQNWAHRDLKPPNIFVVDTSPWWVKIGDFGISKRIRSGNTRFQTMIGTLDFVAPEVLNLVSEVDDEDTGDEEDEYTVAVDMWSLGCVIFQLLTLETPFANRKKLGSYCRSKLEKFPLVPLHQSAVSAAATEVIRGLLEPSPSHRTIADAALRCEWIQGVPSSSDYEHESQDTSRNSEAQKNPFTATDDGIFSEAQKAKEDTGINQGFQSGPVDIDSFRSMTAKNSGHDLNLQEEVQINGLEYDSNKSEGSRVLQTPSKPQAAKSPSSYEAVPNTKNEMELKREAPPLSATSPSDVAKDRPSEDGKGLLTISAILEQQKRSISRNSKNLQFPRPPASSLHSSKPPSLRNGSPREANLNSAAGPNIKRPSAGGHGAAGERPKDVRRNDDASNHRKVKAASPSVPRINRGSNQPLSTSIRSPGEQMEDPSLVGAFKGLSTTEQRPKAGMTASTAHCSSFNIKPVFDFNKARQPMAKQGEPQEEAQEAKQLSSVFVFGLEKQHSEDGPRHEKQVQTDSTSETPRVSVPPVSIEERPRIGDLKSEHPQSTGTLKALLISINHYVRNGQSKTNIRDVKATADYLVRALHYGKSDVALLTRNYCSASKEDVISAFTWFIKDTKAGDTRFLHFSGSVMFEELFKPLRHPIPKAARFTVVIDTSVSVVPFRLEYVYERKEYGLIQSTLSPTKARSKNRQQSEGDIVVWYCGYQSPSISGNPVPLSRDFMSIHQGPRIFQLTYMNMLEALQIVSEGEFKRTAVLASNHPIDLDSPIVL
ncbi:MAG: hypothetical protein Q9195_008440 [Heterodermia aff. obscurata]